MPENRYNYPDIFCQNQRQTEHVAEALAAGAKAGDIFALSGDLGAGKSTFARAFIRAAMGNPEAEVPSPTFTLVQSYAAPAYDILHTDLYRLEGPDDVYDLGLDDDLDSAVFLVEWPDRMPASWWRGALEIRMIRGGATAEAGDEARRLFFASNSNRWQQMLEGLL